MLLVKPFVLRYKHARGEHVHVHGAEEGAEVSEIVKIIIFKKFANCIDGAVDMI